MYIFKEKKKEIKKKREKTMYLYKFENNVLY
jgi:hypothetical protein